MIIKGTSKIKTLDDWRRLAPPKKPILHWKDGRSAKELAIAWTSVAINSMPIEIIEVLSSRPKVFGLIKDWEAEPEALQRFDTFKGEARNCDLAIEAKDTEGTFLVAIEAKADEPFDATVCEILDKAIKRKKLNPKSHGVKRIGQLVTALFGSHLEEEPSIGTLRYQLLTSVAGAFGEAEKRGINRVILLIHEFITDLTSDKKHLSNANDLNLFVNRISDGKVSTVKSNYLYGPFLIPGKPLISTKIPLFIGKAIRNIRTRR